MYESPNLIFNQMEVFQSPVNSCWGGGKAIFDLPGDGIGHISANIKACGNSKKFDVKDWVKKNYFKDNKKYNKWVSTICNPSNNWANTKTPGFHTIHS